ncbi:MAG: M15 family metallopeptidase [Myxococcales bacterium]|nr:M15 family metallopeptidase [Myxococcales bacterium]
MSVNFQKSVDDYKNQDGVELHFGLADRELLRGENFLTKQFGDPYDKDFLEKLTLPLCPRDFGFTRSEPQVRYHKDLFPLVTYALREVQKIAASIGYELRRLNGYYFRYARCGRTKKELRDNKKFEEEAWRWYRERHPGASSWDKLFHIALAEYDRDVRGAKATESAHPSNHAFGIAFDINPSENDLNHFKFDMPVEIVTFLRKLGFFWGGHFNEPDAMHFQFGLENPKGAVPGVSAPMGGRSCRFPLGDPNRMGSPLRAYWNVESNETGVGGYYGLGLNRNLHGGVHMFPEGPTPAPVRSMAPGYIAAVRLSQRQEASPAMTFAQNWNGFVLVRHDIRWRDSGKEEFSDKKALPLYSLYMHTAPLSFEPPATPPEPRGGDKKGAETPVVPWFQSLLEQRYGTFTKIDEDAEGAAGTTYWSKVPVTGKFQPGQSFAVHGAPKPIVPLDDLDENRRERWLFKEKPLDVGKVIEALQKGQIVSFDEPFFPVAEGEMIGLVERPPPGAAPPAAPRAGDKAAPAAAPTPAFVHWEVFSPAQDGGSSVREVLRLTGDHFPELKKAFSADKLIKETTEDNFLEFDEIKGKLLPALSPSDRKVLEAAVDAWKERQQSLGFVDLGRRSDIIDLFGDGASFAPKKRCDATGDFVGKPFTYPVQIEVERDGLAESSRLASDGPYELKLEYFKDDAGRSATPYGTLIGKQTLIVEAGPPSGKKDEPEILTFTVHVPAQADRVRVTAPKEGALVLGDAETPEPDAAGTGLLADMAAQRWRGARLTHLSEWSPKAVEKLLGKLKTEGIFTAEADAKAQKEIAWWKDDAWSVFRSKTADAEWLNMKAVGIPLLHDNKETVKAAGSKGSLFGDQLPPDAHVDNLHPVTMVWLLSILQKKGLLELQVARRAIFRKEDADPVAMGWIVHGGRSRVELGTPVHVLVINDDFGYDPTVALTIKAQGAGLSLPIANRAPYGPNGVFVKALAVDFWGSFKLQLHGAKNAPKRLGPETLEIAAPMLRDTDADDLAASRYRPRRSGSGLVWCVKADEHAPLPRLLNGFVAVEVSTDGKSWSEPTVNGKNRCVPAQARTLSFQTPVEITQDVVVEDDVVVGIAKTFGKGTPKVTKNIEYAELQRAYTDLSVSCALADALHEIGCRDGDIKSLDHAGMSATIAVPASWRRVHEIATKALASDRFSKVAIVGQQAPLTEDELDENVRMPETERLSSLLRQGLELTVKPTGVAACKNLLIEGLRIEGSHIRGFEGTSQRITSQLTLAAFVRKAPARISCVLANGLEQLRGKAKRCVVSRLSWDGSKCVIDGDGAFAAAQEISAFADVSVVEENKRKKLVLFAPAQQGVVVRFDPTQLLEEIRAEESKGGRLRTDDGRLHYRFSFCAVNGASLRAPGVEFGGGPAGVDQDLFGSLAGSSQAVIARCAGASGVLTPKRFGPITAKLIEDEIVVNVPLVGGADLWVGTAISFKADPSDGKKPSRVVVKPGVTSVGQTFKRRGEAPLEVTVEPDGTGGGGAKLKASLKLLLEPRILAEPQMAVAEEDGYLVLWCRTEGIPAARGAQPELPFAYGGRGAGKVVSVRGASRKHVPLVLEVVPERVTPPLSPLPLPVSYYAPVHKGGGLVDPNGVFAARIQANLVAPGAYYKVSLKAPGLPHIRPVNRQVMLRAGSPKGPLL